MISGSRKNSGERQTVTDFERRATKFATKREDVDGHSDEIAAPIPDLAAAIIFGESQAPEVTGWTQAHAPHVLDRRMLVAMVTGRLMEAAIPRAVWPRSVCSRRRGPSLGRGEAKSGRESGGVSRFTCSFRRLTRTPYRAARSESRMALYPRRIGIARSTRSTGTRLVVLTSGLWATHPDALLGHCADRSPLHHRCDPKLLREVTRKIDRHLLVVGHLAVLGETLLCRHFLKDTPGGVPIKVLIPRQEQGVEEAVAP